MSDFKVGSKVFRMNSKCKEYGTVLEVIIKKGKPLMLKLQFKNSIKLTYANHIYHDLDIEPIKGDIIIFTNSSMIYKATVIKNCAKTIKVQTLNTGMLYTVKKEKLGLIKMCKSHLLQLMA